MALSEEAKALYAAGLRGVNADVVQRTETPEFVQVYKDIQKYGVTAAPDILPVSTYKPKTEHEKTSGDLMWERGSQSNEPKSYQAKLKAESAKKKLEDYQASDEYKQAAEERYKQAEQKQKEQNVVNLFMGKDPSFSAVQPEADPVETRLKAEYDQAQAEADALANEEVMVSDLEAITGLSNEDRRMLEQYAVGRDVDFYDSLNMAQNGFQIGRAEQNAAPLIEKYGKEQVDKWANSWMRNQNQKMASEAAAAGQQGGKDYWFEHSVLSVPAKIAGGIGGTLAYIKDLGRHDDRYTTLSPDNEGNIFSTYGSAVQSQVAQDAEEKHGKIVSIAYQGAMSAADSIARAYLGGGAFGGAALAATGSFSQTMADASRQGATPAQAALLATVNSGIEALSEKIPLDDLIKTAKGTNGTAVLKNVFRQMGIEATTEEISLLGTLLSEAAILQEKSGYNQTVTTQLLMGKSLEEARKAAAEEIWDEAVNTALVSAVAGAGSSALASVRAARNAAPELDTASPNKSADQMAQEAIANNRARHEAMAAEEAARPVQKPETASQPQQPTVETQPAQPVQQAPTQPKTAQEVVDEILTGNQNNATQNAQQTAQDKQKEIVDLFVNTNKGNAAATEAAKEVNGNPETDSDYQDEFENWGADPNREGVEDPLAGRNHSEVGKRNVKAYMYENPAVKPFYQEQAAWLLSELNDTTKGERTYNEQLHYESGGEQGWTGTKRQTSDSIAQLLDESGMTYDQIEKGLTAIINDNGQENNAVSKRIEFIINDRLMNGYTDFYTGKRVSGNAEYLNLLRNQQSTPTTDMQTDASNQSAEGGQNMAMETRDSLRHSEVPGQQTLVEQRPVQEQSTLGRQNLPSGDIDQSRTYTNTGMRSADDDIRSAYKDTMRKHPHAADYQVKHNKDTLATAQERTATLEQAQKEYDYLLKKADWTAEDNVTAKLVIKRLYKDGGDQAAKDIVSLQAKIADINTRAGQIAQSNRTIGTMKAAENTETAVDAFYDSLDSMKQGDTVYSPKSGKDFEAWKEELKTQVTRIGIAIESVDDGDAGAMRRVIQEIARKRKTTAFFGRSDKLTNSAIRVLNKLEFDDLKKIANTQVAAMADDFRRRSKQEVISNVRKQSMLSSLKTVARNISGNGVGGFADSVSDSFAGRAMDVMLSKITGKRTVGNDFKYGKDFVDAAKDAGQFASLCVELNIPIETDVDSSFQTAAGNGSNEKYVGRAFRANGNPAMRVLYAYQKYMSYALEVTDKIFEGGTNAAVSESLNNLQNSGLSDTDVDALADYTANRRTFKNATWTDADGKEHGSALARRGAQLQNATGVIGDVVAPFVNVPMNVTQTGIDYTSGIVKGLNEVIGIIKDARNGVEIPVERQRHAASDFGRGMTGTTMIAMFATAAAMGALKAVDDDDWNKEALAQAEGRSGAQINWSALLRGLTDKNTGWEKSDVISSLDFLEPFNTQMYLGYELAQSEDMDALKYAGATAKSIWSSIMDSPVMTGLADIEELVGEFEEAENANDVINAAAGYVGNVASSFVPQWLRQTAQNMDGYYRDTRGATPVETAWNSFRAAIPGQSQDMPKKYSGLGEEQKRGGWFETFADPTATKEYNPNPVTTYLDELTGRTGDNSIYPERQAPMRIEFNDKVVELDGEMRETYQKTYGEKVNELYSGLIDDKNFANLPDDLKTKALKAAEGYAEQFAKASVSEYKEIPEGTAKQLVSDLVNDAVRENVVSLFTDARTAWDYGYDTAEIQSNLESAYDVYDGMSRAAKKQILEDAAGDTAKYLEVRDKGVDTDDYLNTLKKIAGLKPQSGYVDVRDIQEREAIADMPGISDKAKDTLMKAWMTDYDPSAKTVYKTELKYDYAREVLGLSPSEYVDTYNVSLDGGKKAEKIEKWKAMGYTSEEADKLYRLYDATGKTKIDVEAWHYNK